MYMTNIQHTVITITRVLFGWMFFYAGITKVLNPNWSAGFYLEGAKTFSRFYAFLLQPDILPIVNFINAWGLTFLGLSLIFGLFVRISAPLGAILMVMYYFPILDFPKAGDHSYLVDEHVLYAVTLMLLSVLKAGEYWGFDGRKKNVQ